MEAGIEGGFIAFHPYRFKQDELIYSPHFHVLGFGKSINGKEFKEKYGFILKAHAVECKVCKKHPKKCECGDNQKLRYHRWFKMKNGMDEVSGTVYYIMTHAGIYNKANCSSYWYFGEMFPSHDPFNLVAHSSHNTGASIFLTLPTFLIRHGNISPKYQ